MCGGSEFIKYQQILRPCIDIRFAYYKFFRVLIACQVIRRSLVWTSLNSLNQSCFLFQIQVFRHHVCQGPLQGRKDWPCGDRHFESGKPQKDPPVRLHGQGKNYIFDSFGSSLPLIRNLFGSWNILRGSGDPIFLQSLFARHYLRNTHVPSIEVLTTANSPLFLFSLFRSCLYKPHDNTC